MKVSISSKVTLLQPQFLSLTLGISAAFFVLILTLIGMASHTANDLLQLFKVIFPGYQINITGLLLGFIWAFLYGFILGFLVGGFYSQWLAQKVIDCQQPVFEFAPEEKMNIIQEGTGDHPFTVVFVANPVIAKSDGSFEDDPIIADLNLFLRAVVRCLRSFANNELLRLPEIFKRFRLLIVFDDTRRAHADENALCEEISPITDILAPRKSVEIIANFVKNTESDAVHIEYADLIFVISASEQLTRSAARFTRDDDSRGGVPFKFTFSEDLADSHAKQHAYYAQLPGVAAISAWDDRLKTAVHEFAHAMSALENGVIIDEYVDQYAPGTEEGLKFIINRKRRPSPDAAIPDVFAKYEGPGREGVNYFSDRYRSDKPREWSSYVPERLHISSSCIMDIAYFGYRYDKLIFDFMYDRLMAKLNRS